MTHDEIRQIVWQEMQRQLSTVLTGFVSGSDGPTEGIAALLPGIPTIASMPTARPWGLASAPPDGVAQLTVRGGPTASNRLVAGHFDAAAPAVTRGETVLYNQFGQLIRLSDGAVVVTSPSVKLGSDASAQPLVLGTVFQAMMSTVLAAIAAHTHLVSGTVTTGPGSGGTVVGTAGAPLNAATFTAQKSSPIDDGAILSGKSFTEK